ncbi:hypothetical protein PINS_up018908 [Pythium insidiosum]|nr:hypothetical protein PINS_up018908 [Pythium insidiosum]
MNDVRCRYPSKRCHNLRAVKRDGELHRFCEYHRVKANMNQQRLEQRRRIAKRLGTSSSLQFQTTIPPFLLMDPQLFSVHGRTSYTLNPTLQTIDMSTSGLEHVPPPSAELSDMDIAVLMEALTEDITNPSDAPATEDWLLTPTDDVGEWLADAGMSICL